MEKETCGSCGKEFPKTSALCPFCNTRRDWAPPSGQPDPEQKARSGDLGAVLAAAGAKTAADQPDDRAEAMLALTCPKCGDGRGRLPILVETWEDTGLTFTGKQTWTVRSAELAGFCPECTAGIRKRRWMATVLAALPVWALALSAGAGWGSSGGVLVVALYALYLVKHTGYSWADRLLYGWDIGFMLHGAAARINPGGGDVKFPLTWMQTFVRLGVWLLVTFLMLVMGEFFRVTANMGLTSPQPRQEGSAEEPFPRPDVEDLPVQGPAAFLEELRKVSEKKDVEAFRRLVSQVSAPKSYRAPGTGGTLLHYAAQLDDQKLILDLCGVGLSVLTRDTNNGFIPLHWSARANAKRSAETLLTLKSPVEARGKNGHTPLHVAIMSRSIRVLDVLLRHGADPRDRIPNGMDAYKLAESKNYTDVLQILKRQALPRRQGKSRKTGGKI